MKTPTPLDCGHAFRRPHADGLALTGDFPAVVSRSEGLVSGTVALRGEAESREAVVSPQADVFLVRDGLVATVPMVQDAMGVSVSLTAGEVVTLPAIGSLVRCDSDESEGSLLGPGVYEIYARMLLSYDDGSGEECFGGPWPMELRE